MGNRGRRSAASLEVMRPQSALEVLQRLKPPHDLTDEEVEIWVSVVEVWPADWFSPATAPILAQYCRHAVHARRVAEIIEQTSGQPDFSVEAYDRLLKMQERESRAIASLATKMRISQQALRNERGNKAGTPVARRPWEPRRSRNRVD